MTRWSTPAATRVVVAALLAALGLGLVAGCSSDSVDAGALGTGGAQASLRAEAQSVLDARAEALRAGDLPGWMASVDPVDKALVARQRRLFRNLQELPLQVLDYRVTDRVWPSVLAAPRWGSDVYLPRVRVSIQLAGYDPVPVERLTGLAFARRRGSLVIVGDRTRSGLPFPESQPAPWELTRIQVRDTGDVLAIYDERSYRRADEVNRAVEDGVFAIQAALPFDWPGRVVVYVFSDPQVLASFDEVPGGNIRHLGALTFPVHAHLGDRTPVGSRFVLLPSSVAAGEPFLGRIVRHELTHVAVGYRDDGDPTWLSEGLAEYLSAVELPPSQRRISTSAVSRARGRVDAMPATGAFNGPDQEWHYALSWMACDYIAATQGQHRLWQLVRALHARGAGTPDDRQDGVLLAVIGMDSHQLAQRAAHRILSIYG